MTCIAGLVDKASGKVWIGADSLGTGDAGGCSISTYKKLFRVDNFLIGCAGSPRPGQILRYNFKPPVYDGRDVAEYMVISVVDAIKECLDKEKLKDEEKVYLLAGFKGRLFGIYQSDYQIEEDESGYCAIGVGADIAVGSLYTTEGMVDWLPGSRIKMALEASEKHNAHVCRPFLIESV